MRSELLKILTLTGCILSLSSPTRAADDIFIVPQPTGSLPVSFEIQDPEF